jgi:predicted transcriptional regulator
MIGVRVEAAVRQRLDALARAEDRSLSYVAARLMRTALDGKAAPGQPDAAAAAARIKELERDLAAMRKKLAEYAGTGIDSPLLRIEMLQERINILEVQLAAKGKQPNQRELEKLRKDQAMQRSRTRQLVKGTRMFMEAAKRMKQVFHSDRKEVSKNMLDDCLADVLAIERTLDRYPSKDWAKDYPEPPKPADGVK